MRSAEQYAATIRQFINMKRNFGADKLAADAEAALAALLEQQQQQERLLDEARVRLKQLEAEREIGTQTQRCPNPECSVKTLGSGYSECPHCGSALARLGAAAPQQEPPTSGDDGDAVVSEETRPL